MGQKLSVLPCHTCLQEHPVDDIVRLKCDHLWCKDCLANWVRIAILDEARFPPRCCDQQGIHISDLRKNLAKSLLRDFVAARYEYSIADRTSCHAAACGTWIAPHSIHNGDAICQTCLSRTCAKCKEKWHFGPCKTDDNFNDLAFSKGWVRCNRCKRWIEKMGGCDHMACPCGNAFCYRCKEDRGSCECVYDPDFLAEATMYERYAAFQDLHWGGAPHRFERIAGRSHRCQICRTEFRGWINFCGECGLTACNQCRG